MNAYVVGKGKDQRIHSSAFIFAASYSPVIGPTFASSPFSQENSPSPAFVYNRARIRLNLTPAFTSRSDPSRSGFQSPLHLNFEGRGEEEEEEEEQEQEEQEQE